MGEPSICHIRADKQICYCWLRRWSIKATIGARGHISCTSQPVASCHVPLGNQILAKVATFSTIVTSHLSFLPPPYPQWKLIGYINHGKLGGKNAFYCGLASWMSEISEWKSERPSCRAPSFGCCTISSFVEQLTVLHPCILISTAPFQGSGVIPAQEMH